MTTKAPGSGRPDKAVAGQQNTQREHDQDRDPPRTAVPPGSPKRPFEKPTSDDPEHDQDSEAPRTAVPPK